MLKRILKLKGAQQLSKNHKKSISGGFGVPQLCYCQNLQYEVECDKFDQVCPSDY